ncbi:MAG: hypothetical protein ACFFCS_19205 [Candidatus Hodarchaeota archaeon]
MKPKSRENNLIALFICFSIYFFTLGIISNTFDAVLLQDAVILGIITLLVSGLYIFIPRQFKTHLTGFLTILIVTILMIITTNVMIQIFLLFFMLANIIYLIFYHGIYTACIDQIKEQGITSEEYIKDFNFSLEKTKEKEIE